MLSVFKKNQWTTSLHRLVTTIEKTISYKPSRHFIGYYSYRTNLAIIDFLNEALVILDKKWLMMCKLRRPIAAEKFRTITLLKEQAINVTRWSSEFYDVKKIEINLGIRSINC